jgi:hypothetical protein
MKNCNQCHLWFEESNFHKRTKSPDGLQHRCKDCSKKNSKKFRVEHPDYYWGTDESYFVQNRDKLVVYEKEYYGATNMGKIYTIETPGGLYVGTTRRKIHLKQQCHRDNIRRYLKGNINETNIECINRELVKWPLEKAIDAINNLQIVDYFNGDHSEMIRRRKDIIKQLVENGEKVVNVIFHPKKKKILKKVVKFIDID